MIEPLDFPHTTLFLLGTYFAGVSLYVWLLPARFLDRYSERWHERLEPVFGEVSQDRIIWHVRIIYLAALVLVATAFLLF